jgi:fido (protein-threonine AMPylation protein)
VEDITDRFRDQPPGATPLEEDDLAGLRLDWLATRAELDEAESANNLRGRTWAFAARGRSAAWLLTPRRLHQLHQRMYGDVWKWAGKPRRRDTNIGVDWVRIPIELQMLCDNVIAQIGDGSNLAYPAFRARRAISPPVGVRPPLPEREWQTLPARGRPARRQPRRGPDHLGQRQSDRRR